MTKEEIKAVRDRLGMTQLDFAIKLGTTPTSVCRWEKGDVKPRKVYVKQMLQMEEN